jgi:hypothetical protein
LLDNNVTLIITIKKSVQENLPKMSTRIHPKNVHENSPKKRTSCGQKCPRKFTKSVQENSPFLSTKIHPLCPREVCYPCKVTSMSISQLVAHTRIFRLFMKGKLDHYVHTVTLGLKDQKLKSSPVYCSQLYSICTYNCNVNQSLTNI